MKDVVIRIKNERQWKVVQHVVFMLGGKWPVYGASLSDGYDDLVYGSRTIGIQDDVMRYNYPEEDSVSFSKGLLTLLESATPDNGEWKEVLYEYDICDGYRSFAEDLSKALLREVDKKISRALQ